MTSRMALIIGAPDKKIPGVNADINNLKKYLQSPVGGFWYQNEIVTLTSPTKSEIGKGINCLKNKGYSLVFFAGHGFHSIERRSTILHINSTETIDSLELRGGAQKHTLILDCCRKLESERRLLKSAMEESAFFSQRRQELNPVDCRLYFEKAVSECSEGIVVMNSCSINETAGENESEGGYYTSSLIDAANKWARKEMLSVDLSKNYRILSTQECHVTAVESVKSLSGGRQKPSFDSPRTEKKFPFAVIA